MSHGAISWTMDDVVKSILHTVCNISSPVIDAIVDTARSTLFHDVIYHHPDCARNTNIHAQHGEQGLSFTEYDGGSCEEKSRYAPDTRFRTECSPGTKKTLCLPKRYKKITRHMNHIPPPHPPRAALG